METEPRVPENGEQSNGSQIPTEREAYFTALRLWIQHAQMYHQISSCFPYYMMSHLPPNTSAPLLNNNYQFQGQPWPLQPPTVVPPQPIPNNANGVTSPAEVIARNGGYEYVIPSFHKRLVAELIDFILLFVIKLLVTFVAVDTFEFIDLEKFDFYKFGENFDDYQLAIELTSEILFLEIIYRIVVCIFEACCLSGSVGRIGGATPGKALLGLRVVSATAIVPVPGRPRETVLLYPGRPLTFLSALMRSILKNLLISLLFPLCFVLFVFKHNRTGYDLICGVVVVEENMFPPRRQVP